MNYIENNKSEEFEIFLGSGLKSNHFFDPLNLASVFNKYMLLKEAMDKSVNTVSEEDIHNAFSKPSLPKLKIEDEINEYAVAINLLTE